MTNGNGEKDDEWDRMVKLADELICWFRDKEVPFDMCIAAMGVVISAMMRIDSSQADADDMVKKFQKTLELSVRSLGDFIERQN
jgi:hypothetical protein